MSNSSAEEALGQLTTDWERFVATQSARPSLRPLIAESWSRCRAAGIDPDQAALHRVEDEDLTQRLAANSELMELARPHLEWISAASEAMPHVVYLTDRDGIVLDSIGNDASLSYEAGLLPGFDWSEARMGTNGAGTALATGEPVAVVASEHFVRAFHGCTCTAAPVRDAGGAIIGAIDLTTGNLPGAPSRLAVVAYAVRAISGELVAKRAAAQHATDAWLRLAMEAGDLGAWEVDYIDGTIRWDERVRRITGRSGPRVVPIAEGLASVHPDDRARAEHAIALATDPAGDGRLEAHVRVLRADGGVRWVTCCGQTVFEGEGPGRRAVRMMGTLADVTETRQAELALRESEERHRTLFETMAQGAVYQDREGQITAANPAAEQILGLTLDQMRGRTSVDPRWRAIHGDGSDFPGEEHPAMVALRMGREIDGVLMGVSNPAEQGTRWIVIHARPQFRAGESRPYQVYTTFTDITERKRAEEALRASEERFRALAESGVVGLMCWELSGAVTYANEEFLAMVGFTREDLDAGRLDWRKLSPPDWEQANPLPLQELRERGVVTPFEKEYLRKDGGRIPVLIGAAAFEGTRERGVALVLDMTEKRKAERELRRLYDEAQRAVRAREEVVAVVSHDLRNPLNTVAMASALLLEDISEEKKQVQAAIIRRSVEQMNRLIGDLLDVSKIAAGRLSIHLDREDPVALLRAAAQLMAPLAEAHGLALELGDPGPLPPVRVDWDRLLQVFSNLIGNAIEHTPAGGRVALRAKRSAEEGAIVFAVQDNGPGIAAEELTSIFERFWQGRTERSSGAGLGLAICKGIIEAHGGRIWVESAVSSGSTFSFAIPMDMSDSTGVALMARDPAWPASESGARSSTGS